MPDNHFKYSDLIISGQKYNHEELNKVCHTKLLQNEIPDWEKAFYQFIDEWLQPTQYVNVMTSGSTGAPKTLKVAKSAMLQSAFNTLSFFNLEPDMSALLCLPCQYIAGKMMVVRAFAGKLNLIPVPVTSHPLEHLNQSVDFAAMTPFQIGHEIEAKPPRTHLLKSVILGGSTTTPELSKKLQDQPFRAWETYGMTETLSHIALRPVNGKNASQLFSPLPNITINTDNRGCLIVFAPNITSKPIITNDLAEVHQNGNFRLRGRMDNIINTGGIKVSPEEIENQISSIVTKPFYISSTPHPYLGQQLVLVLENDPENKKQLINKLKELLHPYHVPRSIVIKNPIPRTQTGKIKRERPDQSDKHLY